jgi:hypothetical protein
MFGSADIKVRPLKLAYLVDPNNAQQVGEAIRLSSTLWGGSYCPIIPLHVRMPRTWRDKPLKIPLAKDVIRGYLEAFDPDALVQLSSNIPDYISSKGLRILKPEEIWSALREGSTSPHFGIGFFELLGDIYQEHFKYKAKYPVKVIVPQVPRNLSLFWAALFGELPAEVMPLLQKHYVEPLEIETIEFRPDKLTEVMAGNVLFPRRVTQWGLSPSGRSGFGRDAFVYFLDASKVEDIVDFWNLRALGKRVIPVPKQLQTDFQLRDLVIGFLKAERLPWRHNPKVCDVASIVPARNCTMEEVQEFAKTLKIDCEPQDPSEDGFFALQRWYPRVWDEWARDKDGAVPPDIYCKEEDSIEIGQEDLTIRFTPVLPKFADKYGYGDAPRCANEISFRIYGSQEYLAEVFPQSSGEHFLRAISSFTSFSGDWRIGRNGLVKLVKDTIRESREIPTAESVMFSWLRDKGWESALSPPGLLARQIYRQLDGFPVTLKNERLLGLLERMNGGSVKPDGSPVEENKSGQERDLSVGEVKKRLEGSPAGNRLYETLISKGIFKLGLRIQCSHCLRHSWLHLENIRESFTCPRCLKVSVAIGTMDTGTWSYKTTGPFSVPGYADGAYAVLLTLDCFDDRKLTTMRTTPVFSFTAKAPGKNQLEADLAFSGSSRYTGKRETVSHSENVRLITGLKRKTSTACVTSRRRSPERC